MRHKITKVHPASKVSFDDLVEYVKNARAQGIKGKNIAKTLNQKGALLIGGRTGGAAREIQQWDVSGIAGGGGLPIITVRGPYTKKTRPITTDKAPDIIQDATEVLTSNLSEEMKRRFLKSIVGVV